MLCPRCNNVLTKTSSHRININLCPNCRGAWLDSEDLEKLIEPSVDADVKNTNQNEKANDGLQDHQDNHGRHGQQNGHVRRRYGRGHQ